jgi:hypothetical protein
MKEKTKANELISTFGKELALKVVDEIQSTKGIYVNDVEYDYWEEVKEEIIKQQEFDTIEQAKEFVNSINNNQTFKQQEQ